MDAIASTHKVIPIRKLVAGPRAMKDRRSKLLRDVLAELNRPRFQTKADRDLSARVTDWPFNFREPVFCWLMGEPWRGDRAAPAPGWPDLGGDRHDHA